MTAEIDRALGFAPDYDLPIPYMPRTREYYPAIGYDPYRWAHYLACPVHRAAPSRSAQCRVALITTAAPYQPDKGDQGPGAAYNAARQILPGLFRRHRGGPRPAHLPHRLRPQAHHGDRSNTWFPLHALRAAAEAGRIGELDAALPRRADQPQPPRHTSRWTAPEILRRAAGRTAPTPPSSCRTARSATRPCSLTARYLEAERHPDRGDGLRQGHRRARRRAALPVQRLPARQRRRQAARPGARRPRRWSWRCACWRPRPARAPPCIAACAGTRMATGSSTT